MGDIKGFARGAGADTHAVGLDEDPFADLARLIEQPIWADAIEARAATTRAEAAPPVLGELHDDLAAALAEEDWSAFTEEDWSAFDEPVAPVARDSDRARAEEGARQRGAGPDASGLVDDHFDAALADALTDDLDGLSLDDVQWDAAPAVPAPVPAPAPSAPVAAARPAAPEPVTAQDAARLESYARWVAPRASKDPAWTERLEQAKAPRVAEPAPSLEDELESAILGLSAPATPHRNVVVQSASYAPEPMREPEPSKPAPVVLDDFDELIASELQMLGGRAGPAAVATSYVSDESWSQDPAFYVSVDDAGAHETLPDEQAPDRAVRARRRRAAPALALAAGVAGIAVVGALAWSGLHENLGLASTGEPLLIKADAEPFKVVPENPGGTSIPNQNKAVYERVAGAPVTPPEQKALVSATEEPIDVAMEAEDEPSYALPGVETEVPGVAFGASEADNEAPTQVADATPASAAPVPVLQPRQVQTFTVRPDGTLSSAPAPTESKTADAAPGPGAADGAAKPTLMAGIAGGATTAPALLPVSDPVERSRPATAAAPEAEASVSQTDSAATASVTAPTAAAGETVIESAAPSTNSAQAPVAEAVRAAAETTAPTAHPAPSRAVPLPGTRPGAQPVESLQRAPAAEPMRVASAEAPTAPAPSVGGYYVQISSQPTQALAEESRQRLGGRYAQAIGGRAVSIQAADIPGKGTYYRVRVAAGSKDDAIDLCTRLKSAGGSCFVAR
ncbi:SPOR domain-containing protein [Aurantimonas sp. MSK8Z-1]|uniref:SPOR domain-containing protein n=1 Tax=Mangrovibrevibacter kandeliae TaxID=2968473 RepID=UPI002117E6FC|nr:SPOR domain-containing protein [Aurantimonas sp. MSK8Z-1]MCW4114885.1 SPOR domain-containing protein [Aurantimonas sp. MSK8Z-1]